jgi:hypothetical protein
VATFTETNHPLEFLLSEASGSRSRDVVTISSGSGKLYPGMLLGKKTKGALTAVGAAGAPAPAGATITAAPAVTAGVTKPGVHTFRCETAGATGTWQHEDPDGVYVGTATTGTEYVGQGMTLTITDAGADPAIGEVLKVTVSQAAGDAEYVPATASATNGTDTAIAVLAYPVDATDVDVKAVAIVRDAEVISASLLYGTTIDDATKKAAARAQLASVGIIAR